MKEIDEKIKKTLGKGRSAENLHLLGDLHLKKGDKPTAIYYFFEAAEAAQKDKAIAIYKKILRFSPNEMRAVQSLITIYSKTGLMAEEIKYLLLLAEYHRSRGEGEEEIKVFRKVRALDPEHEAVVHYFGRGKMGDEEMNPAEEEQARGTWLPGPDSEASGVVSERGNEHVTTESAPVSEPVRHESVVRGDVRNPPEDGEPGIMMADSEPPQDEPGEFGRAKMEENNSVPQEDGGKGIVSLLKRTPFLLTATAAILIIVAGVVFLSHRGGSRKSGDAGGQATTKNARTADTITVEGNTLRAEVHRLTGDLLREAPELSVLPPAELKANGFLLVTLRAERGCIPGDLVNFTQGKISIIGKEGSLFAPAEVGGLQSLNRVIYKQGVCGTGSGAVYAQLHFAYRNAIEVRGLLIGGEKILFEKSGADAYTQGQKKQQRPTNSHEGA